MYTKVAVHDSSLFALKTQIQKGKFKGRFMRLYLQFPVLNVKGFPVKNKNTRGALATVYHTFDDTYSEFNSLPNDLITNL